MRIWLVRLAKVFVPFSLLALFMAFLLPMVTPGAHVIDLAPQRLIFEVTGEKGESELLEVEAHYWATGNYEKLWLSVPDGQQLTGANVYFSQGTFVTEKWGCSEYFPKTNSIPARMVPLEPISTRQRDRANAIDNGTRGLPVKFGVVDAEWTESVTIVADSTNELLGVYCERETDLWPFVHGNYRAFVPPVITIDVGKGQRFEFSASRDLWFVGEAIPAAGISHFGTELNDPAERGVKSERISWRDDPLLFLDTTAERLDVAVLFVLGGFFGVAVSWVPKAVREAASMRDKRISRRSTALLRKIRFRKLVEKSGRRLSSTRISRRMPAVVTKKVRRKRRKRG